MYEDETCFSQYENICMLSLIKTMSLSKKLNFNSSESLVLQYGKSDEVGVHCFIINSSYGSFKAVS